jgi:uncharacterized membrane protein
MRIADVFQMNDWPTRRLLIVAFASATIVWGSAGLEEMEIELPGMRQIGGMFFLTIVPGALILRNLGFHGIGRLKAFSYTIGLSLSSIMAVGLFINTILPLFHISHPIGFFTMMGGMSLLVVFLGALCRFTNKDFDEHEFIEVKKFFSPVALFLGALVILSITGAFVANSQSNSSLLVVLLVVVSLLPILIWIKGFLPETLYAYAVATVSISLLFHASLISRYLWGWDIQYEYLFSHMVIADSIWDPSIPIMANGMLSVVMIAPTFSMVCDITLTDVFKIVYPLIMSLVPVVLFRIYQSQVGSRLAFLSTFLFVSFFAFYFVMVQLARQEVAELFVVLLVLTMLERRSSSMQTTLLLIIFGISLVVSHYGLTYILILVLLAGWLLLRRNRECGLHAPSQLISLRWLALCFIIAISWYTYVAGSSSFISVVRIADHIREAFVASFLDPNSVEGVALVAASVSSPLHQFSKLIQIMMQLFIALGLVASVLGRKRRWFRADFLGLGIVSFGLMAAGLTVPFFSGSLNTSRLYQFGLLFLAPFSVVGVTALWSLIRRTTHRSESRFDPVTPYKAFSIFLAAFLLVNSGLLYNLAGDAPTSIALDASVDFPRFNTQEMICAEWIHDTAPDMSIFSDQYRWLIFVNFGVLAPNSIPADSNKLPLESYIFVGTSNIMMKAILVDSGTGATRLPEYVDMTQYTYNRGCIVSTGDAMVYH